MIIKNLVKSAVDKFKSFSRKEQLLFIAVASVFMHFIITGIVVLGLFIIILSTKQYRQEIIRVKGFKLMASIMLMLLVVPAFYQRWISVLAGLLMIMVLSFILFVQSTITVKSYHIAMDIACGMSIVCFLYALVEKLILGWCFRSTAGLLNANYYGTIIEFIILISVYRIITNTKRSKFYLAILSINVIGLFLCDCQSAWLAIIAGVLVILFMNGYKKHACIFMVAAAILVAVGVLVPGILPRWDKMPQTFATRMEIWTTAIKGIKAHLVFGQGTLSYLFNHELYGGYKTYHAHSLYLDPLLSYGIVGVSLIIAYALLFIKKAKQSVKLKNGSTIKSVVFAVMLAVCVHGVTDISILWIQTGMLCGFLLSGGFASEEDTAQLSYQPDV